MKKLYFIVSLLTVTSVAVAQKAQIGSSKLVNLTSTRVVVDTLTNVESNDTLAIYNSDSWGYAFGHNNYGDKGWAEKYRITGTASVLGGAYYLFANTINTPATNAFGRVYSVAATGLPGTQLGTANIPYSTIPTGGADLTYFGFSAPVAVADSFFMAFVVPNYTSTQDTIGLISTRDGNRESGTFGQNAALWNDNTWHDELTGNWGTNLTYLLMPIIDFPTSNGSVAKGGLTISASYPNPATSEVVIPFEVENAGVSTIEIYSMSGVKVSSVEVEAGKGANKITVSTSSLASGTYFYSVASENTRLFSKFEVIK